LEKIDSDLLNFIGPFNDTSGLNQSLRVLRINMLSDGTALTGSNSERVSGSYRSYHPGGFQLLLGDGSVRFVNDSIAPQTYINLMRRPDGQVLVTFDVGELLRSSSLR